MRRKLILAAVSILVLPVGFSLSRSSNVHNAAPFGAVALAGHTVSGTWCECGTPGCICETDELAGRNGASPSDGIDSSDQDATPVSADGTSGFNLGSGALMLALAFVLWTRMRA